MAKWIIYDAVTGSLIRAINLPYEGVHVDITVMDEDTFRQLAQSLHTKKVRMKDGTHETDAQGLPIFEKKIKPA